MKTIRISEIMDAARNGHPVTTLKLRDASRAVSNASGEMIVNTDIFYSGRVGALKEGDEVIEVRKKRMNLSELERQLRQLVGKGIVYIVQNGIAMEGELE